MIERFLSSGSVSNSTVSESEHCVEIKRGGKLSNEKLAAILVYVFENLLPEHGYSLRPEQLHLAKDIFEAFSERKVSLAEAGVGIGKTHAYLIAAAIIKRGRANDFWLRSCYPGIAYITELPVVVATSSIALQKAIAREYIPEISKILMAHGIITKPLTYAIRKGKEHYICERRLRQFWQQSSRDGVKRLLKPLVNGKGNIDLDEIDDLDAHTKRRINVTGGCGENCNLLKVCRHHAFLKAAQSDKTDFQICKQAITV